MNLELFLAKKINYNSKGEKVISRLATNISVIGIALGILVMVLSLSITKGFKNEIINKLVGFSSHIQIMDYNNNSFYETNPINKNQHFLSEINSMEDIEYIQTFATKGCVIKTDDEIQGVVLKGIAENFNTGFFERNIIKGDLFKINNTEKSNSIIISKYLSSLLNVDINDDIKVFFIQHPLRMRKFTISAIYETNLKEFDKLFIYCDIRHIQKINNWTTNQVSGFEINLINIDKLEEVSSNLKNRVNKEFSENHVLLNVSTVTERFPEIFDWLELINMNVYTIMILMTLVSSVTMISGLLIIILECIPMIKILKSLGYSNWNIRKVFVYQSSFIIVKGMFWGNLISITLCLLQSHFKIIKLPPTSYEISYIPIDLTILNIIILDISTFIIIVSMLIIPSYIITKVSIERINHLK